MTKITYKTSSNLDKSHLIGAGDFPVKLNYKNINGVSGVEITKHPEQKSVVYVPAYISDDYDCNLVNQKVQDKITVQLNHTQDTKSSEKENFDYTLNPNIDPMVLVLSYMIRTVYIKQLEAIDKEQGISLTLNQINAENVAKNAEIGYTMAQNAYDQSNLAASKSLWGAWINAIGSVCNALVESKFSDNDTAEEIQMKEERLNTQNLSQRIQVTNEKLGSLGVKINEDLPDLIQDKSKILEHKMVSEALIQRITKLQEDLKDKSVAYAEGKDSLSSYLKPRAEINNLLKDSFEQQYQLNQKSISKFEEINKIDTSKAKLSPIRSEFSAKLAEEVTLKSIDPAIATGYDELIAEVDIKIEDYVSQKTETIDKGIQELKTGITEDSAFLSAFESQYDDYDNELSGLNLKRDNLIKIKELLNSELSNRENKCNNYLVKIESNLQEVSRLEELNKAPLEELNGLVGSKDIRVTIRNLREEISSYRSKINSEEVCIADVKSRIQRNLKDKSQAEASIEDLQNSKNLVNEQINIIKENIIDKKAQIEDYTQKLTFLNKTKARTVEVLETLKKSKALIYTNADGTFHSAIVKADDNTCMLRFFKDSDVEEINFKLSDESAAKYDAQIKDKFNLVKYQIAIKELYPNKYDNKITAANTEVNEIKKYLNTIGENSTPWTFDDNDNSAVLIKKTEDRYMLRINDEDKCLVDLTPEQKKEYDRRMSDLYYLASHKDAIRKLYGDKYDELIENGDKIISGLKRFKGTNGNYNPAYHLSAADNNGIEEAGILYTQQEKLFYSQVITENNKTKIFTAEIDSLELKEYVEKVWENDYAITHNHPAINAIINQTQKVAGYGEDKPEFIKELQNGKFDDVFSRVDKFKLTTDLLNNHEKEVAQIEKSANKLTNEDGSRFMTKLEISISDRRRRYEFIRSSGKQAQAAAWGVKGTFDSQGQQNQAHSNLQSARSRIYGEAMASYSQSLQQLIGQINETLNGILKSTMESLQREWQIMIEATQAR